jgi:AmiR/NasT family two-component response regulator
MDLVQRQATRLQSVEDELHAARQALDERKTIERAKALLIQHRGLSEDQAYKLLRQTAMNQNRRLAEVAEATVAMSDLLGKGGL